MKIIKISFSLLIAFITLGLTFISKANTFGNRILTACFIGITVTDGTNPSQISEALTCQEALGILAFKPFVTNASLSNSHDEEATCAPSDEIYCCVKLVQTSDTRAALLNLGEGGSFRYRVASPVTKDVNVFCKPAH